LYAASPATAAIKHAFDDKNKARAAARALFDRA